MHYFDYYSFGFLGMLPMLIFWIFLILLIFWIFRGQDRRFRNDSYSQNRALDLLNERYAKGEINKEEYEQKKKDIRS